MRAFSFLGDGRYKASMVFDNKENAAAVVTEDRIVRGDDTLTIEMINSGGFVGRFSKQ
jgi:hypothetical protein